MLGLKGCKPELVCSSAASCSSNSNELGAAERGLSLNIDDSAVAVSSHTLRPRDDPIQDIATDD